jgi:hypothetical protein
MEDYMLKTIKLNTWSEFEKAMHAQILYETQEAGYSFCYRGHANEAWRLETTLERTMGVNFSVRRYYEIIKKLLSEIETFTDRNWELPEAMYHVENLSNRVMFNDSVVSYLQYLRHFGYPSPLLDWTYSPFVAAYFAFRDITSNSESVAIYQLMLASDLWTIGGEMSRLQVIHGAARRNKRHYLQQSLYTICMNGDIQNQHFASYEDPEIVGKELLDDDPAGTTYGMMPIRKYILPSSERIAALHSLQAHNINAYSLFGSEESLLESLFLRDYKQMEIIKKIYGDNY